jgi:hypothetical protein
MKTQAGIEENAKTDTTQKARAAAKSRENYFSFKDRAALALAAFPAGRIALHLAALAVSGGFAWHLAGIIRESRFN